MAYKKCDSRRQTTLFPQAIEDYITDDPHCRNYFIRGIQND